MNDNSDIILHKLLHPTLLIRKEGFNDFKELFEALLDKNDSDWKKLREYLWKAIEIEENDVHQAKLVKFIINKLGDKVIRKMIRLVENNHLNLKSIKVLSNSFLEYFNDEIGEALSKSLIRDNSKSFVLAKEILSENNFISTSNAEIYDLLGYIFPNDLKHEIKLDLTKSFIDMKLNKEILQWFISNFSSDESIKLGILNNLCEKKYFWSGSSLNDSFIKAKYLYFFLLESLSSKNLLVRRKSIEILGDFNCIFIKNDSSNEEIIYDFCYFLGKNKLDLDYIKLKDYNFSSLSKLLGCDDQDKQLIKDDTNCVILEEFLKFDIDYFIIYNTILYSLPRKFLIELAKQDPNPLNRKIAYEKLNKESFWIVSKDNNNFEFIGPIQIWVDIIDQIITSLLFETDSNVIYIASNLLSTIINLILTFNEQFKQNIVNRLKEKPRLLTNINNISNNSINLLTIYKLKFLLTEIKNYQLFSDNNIADLREELIKEILFELFENYSMEYQKLISLIIQNGKSKHKKILTDLLLYDLNDLILSTSEEQKSFIHSLIIILIKENDVYIRSKAYLLLKKIK